MTETCFPLFQSSAEGKNKQIPLYPRLAVSVWYSYPQTGWCRYVSVRGSRQIRCWPFVSPCCFTTGLLSLWGFTTSIQNFHNRSFQVSRTSTNTPNFISPCKKCEICTVTSFVGGKRGLASEAKETRFLSNCI